MTPWFDYGQSFLKKVEAFQRFDCVGWGKGKKMRKLSALCFNTLQCLI